MWKRTALVALFLAGCGEAGIQAYSEPDRQLNNPEAQGFWWWWDAGDEEEEEEEPVVEEPGDPAWFDAHCAETEAGLDCTVLDSFEPRDWLQHAHDLCDAERDLDDWRFFVLRFDTDEPMEGDAFRPSGASWAFVFHADDPDDLWGYTDIACTVDVSAGVVELDIDYGGSSVVERPLETVLPQWNHGFADAAADWGSWRDVQSGGMGWVSYEGALMIWLNDDWGSNESWFAETLERDW